MSNLDKFGVKLDGLIQMGGEILADMMKCRSENVEKLKYSGSPNRTYPSFRTSNQGTRSMLLSAYRFLGDRVLNDYQQWYTESSPMVRQLVPHRFDEFSKSYFQDSLDSLFSIPFENGLNPSTSIALKMRRQYQILASSKTQLDGVISNLRHIAQADIFDSQLDSARELLDNGFIRPAGVVAGVVLERALKDLFVDNDITLDRRNPTISWMNDRLKAEGVYDAMVLHKIRWYAGVRNKCSHDDGEEPKKDDVKDMIEGVGKFAKTRS